MTTKEALYRLIDELPERDLATAERLLEHLRDAQGDPVLHALLTAPEDDEPLTPEEEARLQKPAGKLSPHAEVMRELGL
jgi:hypothetical protein